MGSANTTLVAITALATTRMCARVISAVLVLYADVREGASETTARQAAVRATLHILHANITCNPKRPCLTMVGNQVTSHHGTLGSRA